MARTKQVDPSDLALLRSRMPKGTRVYSMISDVASSGMARSVRIFSVQDGQIAEWTRIVARVTGDRVSRSGDAIRVGGCGFDAGHDVVYRLALTLHPDDKTGRALIHDRL